MFEEVSNSIKAYLYERAVSPLMGGFIVSWCLWNYKIILLAISSTPILEKFRIINEGLYDTYLVTFIYGVALPAITTALYIFIYPLPAEYVFKYTQEKQKRLSDIKREIEGSALLSVDEARDIRHKQYILEEQYNIEIDKKNNEIERLKKEIITLSKLAKENNNSIKNNMESTRWSADDVRLEKEEEAILVNIEKHSMNENDIAELFDEEVSITDIRYYIGSLERYGLIEAAKNKSNGLDLYSITHEGLAYIFEILKPRQNRL